jgi:hypothetical protein
MASATYANTPKLKAAGLWQKTRAAGNTYFAGRLGGVNILIFENRDRAGEDEARRTSSISSTAKRRARIPVRRRQQAKRHHRHIGGRPPRHRAGRFRRMLGRSDPRQNRKKDPLDDPVGDLRPWPEDGRNG